MNFRWPTRLRRKRKSRYEEIDPMSFSRRSQAIHVQLARVSDRATRLSRENDIEGLENAVAEAELLLESMRDLRVEQLVAEENGYRREVI